MIFNEFIDSFFKGILDPDTPGSGVQNGDSVTAKEQAEKRRRKYQKNPDEGCC